MAKYSKRSSAKVGRALHEMKRGELKSGRSGKTVRNPRQAIAIGLSEARKEGAKVPSPPRRKAKAKTKTKTATRARSKSGGSRRRPA